MKITIEATDQITSYEGVQVRVWNGTTEGGIPCLVFVHRVAVHKNHDAREFERELHEKMPPALPVSLRDVL